MSSNASFLLTVATIIIFISATQGLAPAPEADAPIPSVTKGPKPINLTGIFDKSGQFTFFLRLLNLTQVGKQLEGQLNNSYEGITIFSPTDNAFQNLKSGTLNSLSPDQQVALVLYHIVPRYCDIDTFQTISNPVKTQATDYQLNITTDGIQVNVSFGAQIVTLSTKLYDKFPLVVYQIDKVLFPEDHFKKVLTQNVPVKPTKPSPSTGSTSEVSSEKSKNSGTSSNYREKSICWVAIGGIWMMIVGFLW